MKLKAFTTPVSHTATAAARTPSLTGVVSRGLMNTQAATAPAEHWSTSRSPTDSPQRSSASPIAAKSATAIPNAADGTLCMSAAAMTSPAAIGTPPPRGVGTVCDDLRPGTSIDDDRRSSMIVTGSAATTMAPAGSAVRMMLIAGGGCAWLPLSAAQIPRSSAAARSSPARWPRASRSRRRFRIGWRIRSAW
jgi:hypothetical protein